MIWLKRYFQRYGGDGWLDRLSNIKANFSWALLGLWYELCNNKSKTKRLIIISLIGHRMLDDLKFKLIEIGLSWDINQFLVWWMGKLDGNKSKVNSFWLFITLETKTHDWNNDKPYDCELETLERGLFFHTPLFDFYYIYLSA